MKNVKNSYIDDCRKEIIERVPELRESTMNASDTAIETAWLMLKLYEKDRSTNVNNLIKR